MYYLLLLCSSYAHLQFLPSLEIEKKCVAGRDWNKREGGKNILPLLRSSAIVALIRLIFVWMDVTAILPFSTS
jgi:hypothetical protein